MTDTTNAIHLFDSSDPDSGMVYDHEDADSLLAWGLNSAIGRTRDLLDDLLRARSAMQAGDRAKVVQVLHDFATEQEHDRSQQIDDPAEHLTHLARGYAYGRVDVYCCSIGMDQQDAVREIGEAQLERTVGLVNG